jgi:hypothetical protein
MNQTCVDDLARALLYEGYILYPYRPSVKNQQRWTFGGIYPPSWSAAQEGTDPRLMQTQCLLTGDGAAVRVVVRFLHLVDRTVGRLTAPLTELPRGTEPEYKLVDRLEVDGQILQPWQEAVEREIDLGRVVLGGLLSDPAEERFTFPAWRSLEPVREKPESEGAAPIVGLLIRRQDAVEGTIELAAVAFAGDLWRLTVRISNCTPLPDAGAQPRDAALMRTFVSTHTILSADPGDFISLTDPPAAQKAHATECFNIGTWPVLAGDPSQAQTLLSSPIILQDYPRLAPESPGDLFDSTEIDEILTLRILTLTDEEKRAAAGTDSRVRELLARTHGLARQQLIGMHGRSRGLKRESPAPQPERGAA